MKIICHRYKINNRINNRLRMAVNNIIVIIFTFYRKKRDLTDPALTVAVLKELIENIADSSKINT